MKRVITVMVMVVMCVLGGTAGALSLNMVGPMYMLSDSDGDGFSELLQLQTAWITLVDPASDNLFADAAFERVVFTELALDPRAFVSGASYDFAAATYHEGFRLFDDDHTLLMTADLSVSSLIVDGGTASLNPSFAMNLSNMIAGSTYQAGSSVILDAFLGAPGGALNLTLQFPGGDLGRQIEDGHTVMGTYSGSMAPVPEPGTVLLLGAGLLGLVGLARKHQRS